MIPVGIDLGTTYSAIAYLGEDGKPIVIPNREGERLTPSVVNFDSQGNPAVGSEAKRMSVENSENTVQYIKRSMGENSWKFVSDNGKTFVAEEISAFILKRLKEDAEMVLGKKITHAVITVPAYFDDARRMATKQAASIAGLETLKIINEPTAAALAYGCGEGEGSAKSDLDSGRKETIAVFDLGGGTFDVTIMDVSSKEMKVLATGGDRNLGGFDFDNALMMRIDGIFKNKYGKSFLEEENGEAVLREKCEQAKKSLTIRETTPLILTYNGERFKTDVSRVDFNESVASLIKRTMSIFAAVMEEAAGINENESPVSLKNLIEKVSLSKILLVGGSTKMPAIKETLEKETGIVPSCGMDPDEAVALGAAVCAGMRIREMMSDKETTRELKEQGISIPSAPPAIPVSIEKMKVTDVNSHGLGIIAVKGKEESEYNVVVMPKNTPIPNEIRRTFHTSVDNQDNLSVRVTEGDDSEVALVKIIGEAVMDIERHPARSPVDVHFKYDENGIVHVEVTDMTTKRFLGEVTINRNSNLDVEELDMLAQKNREISVD